MREECFREAEVLELLSGTIDEALREEMDSHASQCDECREWVAVVAGEDGTGILTAPDRTSLFDALSDESAAERRRAESVPSWLRRGEMFVERFRVERLAARGGMGAVYQARDTLSDQWVALKVELSAKAGQRMLREAELLSRMSHPSSVRCVASGTSENDEAYIAMEWVDGVTLRSGLSRRPFSIVESLRLIATVAEAVGEAHRLGVVHRDLKPENLMLPAGEGAMAKVVDYGLALHTVEERASLREGVAIGTPAYMAPEQVRGVLDVDARSDVFALGTILYECLTGERLFQGDDALAIMSKVVYEPMPELRDKLVSVPNELSRLLRDMLAKDPELRPSDGTAVARRVREVLHGAMRAVETGCEEKMLGGEQRAMTVAIVRGAFEGKPLAEPALASVTRMQEAAKGRAVVLADRSVMLHWHAGAGGRSGALEALRFARHAVGQHPGIKVGLATGVGAMEAGQIDGELLERASLMVRAASLDISLLVDEETVALARDEMSFAKSRAGFRVTGIVDADEPPESLIRLACPFVGRIEEMRSIREALASALREKSLSWVLITGDAGIGKSRVVREVLDDARVSFEGLRAWSVRAREELQPSPYALAAQLLRKVLRVSAGGSAMECASALRRCLQKSLPGKRVETVFQRLSVLISPGSNHSGRLFGLVEMEPVSHRMASLTRAWLEFWGAQAARSPMGLWVDDAQWADSGSLSLLAAMRRASFAHGAAIVLSGRPALLSRHAEMVAFVDGLHLELGPLQRQDASDFLAGVVTPGVPASDVARMLAVGEGNPFFLQELGRAAGRGWEQLPGSVLALTQGSLDELPENWRRVLRAGSVFGERFAAEAAEALLGDRTPDVRGALSALVACGVLARVVDSGLLGCDEFEFQNPIMREAVYSTLPAGDRRIGHRRAGAWLALRGGSPPVGLAEHYEKGGRPDLAAEQWLRAAHQAMTVDVEACIAFCERGVAARPSPRTHEHLLSLQVFAVSWSGDPAQLKAAASSALASMEPGGAAWCDVLMWEAWASHGLGDGAEFERLARLYFAQDAARDSRLPCGFLHRVKLVTLTYPRTPGPPVVQRLLKGADDDEVWRLCGRDAFVDSVRAWYEARRALLRGKPGEAALIFEGLVEGARGEDMVATRASGLRILCELYLFTGRWTLALETVERGERLAREHELTVLRIHFATLGAHLLVAKGEAQEGLQRIDDALQLHSLRSAYARVEAELVRVRAMLQLEQKPELRKEARALVELAEKVSPEQEAEARALFAEVLLREGELTGALVESERALRSLAPSDPASLNVGAARAQCLLAAGKTDEARRAFERAAEAMAMFDAEAREVFVSDPAWASSPPAKVVRGLQMHAVVHEG